MTSDTNNQQITVGINSIHKYIYPDWIKNDFFVPPNEIDFQTVFNNLDQKLKDNWAVLSTLCGFLFLYFLGLIWTRHQDKKDIIKVI
jgi:hypothetical protein